MSELQQIAPNWRFTATEKRKEIEKEIGYRKRVFPRMIDDGRMLASEAERRLALMAAIRQDYLDIENKDRLL